MVPQYTNNEEEVDADDFGGDQSLTQRQKQLPEMKYKVTTHISARQISPQHPQPYDTTTSTSNAAIPSQNMTTKALTKCGKLTSSVQSLGHASKAHRTVGGGAVAGSVSSSSANKPIDRHQSFHVKGKGGLREKSKTGDKNIIRKLKPAATGGGRTGGAGTPRQQRMIHPAFNSIPAEG